jgi:hypothetical protein
MRHRLIIKEYRKLCAAAPLNVDNLVRREIIPAISGTGVEWHDWHAFRRGLATTLHQLRVADKTRMRWARKCKAVQLATIL